MIGIGITGYFHTGKGLAFSEDRDKDLTKLADFLLNNYNEEIKDTEMKDIENVVDFAIRMLKEHKE